VLQKKICLLGAIGVGKTSLTRRYVASIFSDAYLTTVGVKIDKRSVQVGAHEVNLVIWDIAGEDEVSAVRTSYLRGAAGYLLVVDVTRAQTLAVAQSIQARVAAEIGDIPFLCLLNKIDVEDWDIGEAPIETLRAAGWTIERTSAKTGEGVEAAFTELAQRIVGS
jgi:small GTP-binding protein